MEYITPFFLCAIFLFGCFLLCKLILFLHDFFTKRSLLRAPRLGKDAAAALFSLYFGEKSLFLSRFFPYRGTFATMYQEIPCILILGRKLFVLEFCSVEGTICKADDERWIVTPPQNRGKKKEIHIKSPVSQAKEKAEILTSLIEKIHPAFPLSVEPLAVITSKKHRLESFGQDKIMTLPDALEYLKARAPKQKTLPETYSSKEKRLQKKKFQKYLGKETAEIVKFLRKYSLPTRQAMAKNALARRKKK